MRYRWLYLRRNSLKDLTVRRRNRCKFTSILVLSAVEVLLPKRRNIRRMSKSLQRSGTTTITLDTSSWRPIRLTKRNKNSLENSPAHACVHTQETRVKQIETGGRTVKWKSSPVNGPAHGGVHTGERAKQIAFTDKAKLNKRNITNTE